jgi:hypothetical protein
MEIFARAATLSRWEEAASPRCMGAATPVAGLPGFNEIRPSVINPLKPACNTNAE